MKTEIEVDLNKNAIEDIQDLIQVNLASSAGFQSVYSSVTDSEFASLLKLLYERRLRQADELEVYVDSSSAAHEVAGKNVKTIRETWVQCKEALSSGDRANFIDRIVDVEGLIIRAYQSTIKCSMNCAIADILVDHVEQVKKDSDALSRLKADK